MGGLTFLAWGVANATVATVIAALAALAWIMFPVPAEAAENWKKKRALLCAVFTGLLIFGYGCYDMSVSHSAAADPQDVLDDIGLSEFGLLGTQAERIAEGDAGQSYVAAQIEQAQIDAIMRKFPRLNRMDFDAHTAKERGWTVPDWWPKKVCAEGVTYQEVSGSNTSSEPPISFVINWCPHEHRGYIQNFDY